MNQAIVYRLLGSTIWLPGTLVQGLDSSHYAIIDGGVNKGKYVSMDRNGSLKYADTMGPWEGNYSLGTDINVLRITPNVVTYLIEIQEA